MKGSFDIHGIWQFTKKIASGKTIWTIIEDNLITAEELNHVLETEFRNNTQIGEWYIGLKGAGNGAANDTLSSHAGWTEVNNYANNRKLYVPAAAAAGTITNANNKATFVFSANNQVVAGGFLCSAENGTSGTLASVVDFTSGNQTFNNTDTLEVTYTIAANSAS